MDQEQPEQALLVQVIRQSGGAVPIASEHEELVGLARTAGAHIVKTLTQQIESPHPAHLVGKGKVREIAEAQERTGAETILFSENLTPVWQRNLERQIEAKIVDRTELILDIFAQHAKSRDGKVQVELAQLRYRLPRLSGRGIHLSRLGGGIGTRGPGETKLEVDRRRIQARIARLKREVERLAHHRRVERKSRLRKGRVQLSIIGYTNAGKSTLLNALTGADARVEDQLFATLDTTARQADLPSGETVVFSDTVGFIRDLPETLVHAFRATLEEVAYADILLHVVDSTRPTVHEDIHAVDVVLEKIGASRKPTLIVLNKIDKQPDIHRLERMQNAFPESVACSGKRCKGLEALLTHVETMVRQGRRHVLLNIPLAEGRTLSRIHHCAEVVSEEVKDDHMLVEAYVAPRDMAPFGPFLYDRP